MADLTWALSSCVLILAVAGIRAAFGGRMRPGLRYALWGLVLLRLLLPTQLFAAPWGVSAELPERVVYLMPVERRELSDSKMFSSNTDVLRSDEVQDFYELLRDERTKTEPTDHHATAATRYAARWSVSDIVLSVWRVGIAVTAAVFLASNLRFRAQLRKRRKPLDVDCPLRVYAVESLSSSCLFGNAIYVAAETAADETLLRHVLAHELSHHRHGDHVWTLLRCVALTLHWYNPLVWWAAALSRQDGELCADAGALKRLGEDERESYGATLIELSARRAARASLLCTATAMTNGKRSLRERVTMIARRPCMSAAVALAVVTFAAVAAGCAFAGAASAPMTEEEALDALEASVTWQSDGQGESYVAFTLPEAYGRAEDWGIRIAGRAVYPDGTSRSVHEYELLPDVSDWEAGREYTIRADNLTELTFQATLTGQDGKLYERGFDVFLPGFVIEEDASANAGQAVNRDVESGGERRQIQDDLLAQLSPADVRLRCYDGDGLRGSVNGASALTAADYLAAFAEIEWTEADPMDEADRADGHIVLDGPGWRLTSYQSSRKVLIEANGGELWLIARNIPDTQYSWISYATLENWYLDALTAERRRADGTPLTGEELKAWRDALATMQDEELNLAACFFSSYYADPRDLDLSEFLAYCPLSEPVEDEAEFDALNIDWETEDENGVRRPMTLDRMPVPVHRYRVSRINDALMQYAGITLDDLTTDWRRDERMLYASAYDAFYNFTSDFGPGVFVPRYGERDGDAVTLWSNGAVLRLRLLD